MNKATLIDSRYLSLGSLILGNVQSVPLEVVEYYLKTENRDQIPFALTRGFTFVEPQAETLVPRLLGIPSDLDFWIQKSEEFTEKFFGVKVNLRKQFQIPETFPFESVIPIFDPGNITNRDAVQLALRKQELDLCEEVDVMKYDGSTSSGKPALVFINNSVRPDENTMGKSPNQLRKMGKSFLTLRGYALAMGLYHFAKNASKLDSETSTWFPENRLSPDGVADGNWYQRHRKVCFYWLHADYSSARGGARLAISVPPVP